MLGRRQQSAASLTTASAPFFEATFRSESYSSSIISSTIAVDDKRRGNNGGTERVLCLEDDFPHCPQPGPSRRQHHNKRCNPPAHRAHTPDDGPRPYAAGRHRCRRAALWAARGCAWTPAIDCTRAAEPRRYLAAGGRDRAALRASGVGGEARAVVAAWDGHLARARRRARRRTGTHKGGPPSDYSEGNRRPNRDAIEHGWPHDIWTFVLPVHRGWAATSNRRGPSPISCRHAARCGW